MKSTSRPVPTFEPNLYASLRARLNTNLLRLGEEVIEAPDLLMMASEYCALAVAARDIASNDMKVAMAQAAAKIRGRLGADGKKKSETEVTNSLQGHKDVVEAMAEIERTKLDAALWMSLVEAARSKQSMLKRVAEMTVAGYMSTASAYSDRRKEINEVRKSRVRPTSTEDRRGEYDRDR